MRPKVLKKLKKKLKKAEKKFAKIEPLSNKIWADLSKAKSKVQEERNRLEIGDRVIGKELCRQYCCVERTAKGTVHKIKRRKQNDIVDILQADGTISEGWTQWDTMRW